MITNILLGLILGIVITSFIILNKKINQIDNYVRTTLSNTNVIETSIDNNYKMINILLDRFNNFVLRCNEFKGLLETKVNNNNNIKFFDKTITESVNQMNKISELVRVECNEIKKKAKISSKKKKALNQSKSINKQ